MTVIAGLVHAGHVWIAADSSAIDGSGRRWPNTRKVTRLRVGPDHTALIAACGSSGLSALLRAGVVQLPIAPDPADDDEADGWADAVARAVTDMAVDARPAITDEAGHLDGHLLLGHAGRLWGLAEHGAWPFGRFGALGSGGDLALGALEALTAGADDDLLDPETTITRAAEVACRWDAACHGPVKIHSV